MIQESYNKRFLNPEELEWLKNNYPRLGKDFCASKLKKKPSSLLSFANRNNIKLNHCWQENTGEKTCCGCGKTKLLEEFYKNKKRLSGYQDYCKTCKGIKQKESNNRCRKIINSRARERRRNDIIYKIKSNCRSRLAKLFKEGQYKFSKTFGLIGCSPQELKIHLEKQFVGKMSWKNYGRKGWHIDHIKPCNSFDFSNYNEQKECFHYTNLQPLWAKDNLSKGDKL